MLSNMSTKKKVWLGFYAAIGVVIAFYNPSLVMALTGLVHIINLTMA